MATPHLDSRPAPLPRDTGYTAATKAGLDSPRMPAVLGCPRDCSAAPLQRAHGDKSHLPRGFPTPGPAWWSGGPCWEWRRLLGGTAVRPRREPSLVLPPTVQRGGTAQNSHSRGPTRGKCEHASAPKPGPEHPRQRYSRQSPRHPLSRPATHAHPHSGIGISADDADVLTRAAQAGAGNPASSEAVAGHAAVWQHCVGTGGKSEMAQAGAGWV